ncbi:MAG: glucosyltransferase domain-containing protein [Bacteroides sp.]|nr:glucosyltransferase domain-containing protein [Bacteroides sp.]
MINQLTNDYDGLWENSFHNAGTWELSMGRWFWQYISRLRFGTSPDPYTSLITLALMVSGLLLLFDLWNIKNKYIIVLSGLLFISHPAICFELSYRYMSPTFGVAFFLSILAVWCFERIKSPCIAVMAGSVCVALSMGSYQAYICCASVAFLTALLMKLSQNTKWKDIAGFCGRSGIGIVLGGIEYIVILNIYLQKAGIGMSVYQGGDRYSILYSIQNLPSSLQKVYQIFDLYFRGIMYKINRMQEKHIFTVMFVLALMLVALNMIRIFRKSKTKAVVFGLLILLYPAAVLSVLFIATDAPLGLQTACGPALFLAALTCMFCNEKRIEDARQSDQGGRGIGKGGKIPGRIFALFMAGVLYGSIWQVIIDQNIMYEGRIATENIADLVVDKLLQEDLLSNDKQYVFVGIPVASPLYAIDPNYEYANQYALYGAWYWGAHGSRSWRSVLEYRKGLRLNMITGEEYETLSFSEIVTNMPQFPAPGSIVEENDIVYIKIGDASY